MKIFVTGGTGFIGSHLVKKLQQNGHVVAILSSNLAESEQWQKEIGDFNPDAVAHLAWEGLPDYSAEMSAKNIKYSLDLFNFLKEINCQNILSVGSTFEKTNPNDVFPAAKRMIHLWGRALFDNFIWARIFYVYGPGQRETSLIPYLINCAKKNERPEIKNPLGQNDYIYIEDVTEALAILVENGKAGEYEIGRGELVSNQKLINTVAQEFNIESWDKGIELTAQNKASLFRQSRNNETMAKADNSRLREMGWEPKISVEEGIKKVISASRTPRPLGRGRVRSIIKK